MRAALDRAARVRSQPSPEAGTSDERHGDPGYYLIGRGRRGFERSLGFRRDFRLGMLRFILAGATPGYLGTLAVLTALVLAIPLDLARAAGLNTPGLIVLGSALIPASDLAIVLLNRGVAAVVPPASAQLELRDGVPAEFRTMWWCRRCLTGRRSRRQIERLEVPTSRMRTATCDSRCSPTGPMRLPNRRPGTTTFWRRLSRASHASIRVTDRPRMAAIGSCSTIAAGSGTRARASGWDGSASAASCTSSIACCAARPIRRFSGRIRHRRPSGVRYVSRSTPPPGCPSAPSSGS